MKTIKEIINNAATMLGLGDVASGAGQNFEMLLRCAGLVVANIASKHSRLQATEIIPNVPLNGILLSTLSQPLVSVVSVTQAGRPVDYTLSVDRIMTPRGRVTITYNFVPKIKTGDELNPFPLPAEVIEYGVMSEYCFAVGMFNEAQVYRAKMGELMFGAQQLSGTNKTIASSF